MWPITPIMSLLPTAIVCVDEREEWEYRLEVSADHLLVHPQFDGFANVVNWVNRTVTSKIVVMIDDDFELVKSMTGGCRTIRRHEEILSIIENGARVALDLGVSTFTWTRNYNPIMVNAVAMPFKPVGQLAGAFGVIGSAKHRLMDPACSGRN